MKRDLSVALFLSVMLLFGLFLSETNLSKKPLPLSLKRYTTAWRFSTAELATKYFDMAQMWEPAGSQIQQIHEFNPDFTTLFYRNVRAVYPYWTDEYNLFVSNDWILKDQYGDVVYSPYYGIDSIQIVDEGNPECREWIANRIKDVLDQYGFDGVFADNSLGSTAGEIYWGVSNKPINPRTGTFFTDEEARQNLIELHKKIKEKIGSRLLVCNGIWQGPRFYDRYDGYMKVLNNSPLDGIMSEGTWYAYGGLWMMPADWLKSVEFVRWIQTNFLKDHPKRVFVSVCKVTVDSRTYPSGCTKEQMFAFAFASTLLAIENSQNYLCLVSPSENTVEDLSFVNKLHEIPLGYPLNSYHEVEGTRLYARDFSNVKVIVNPTGTPYAVSFKEPWTNALTSETVTELTVTPHSGAILLGTET